MQWKKRLRVQYGSFVPPGIALWAWPCSCGLASSSIPLHEIQLIRVAVWTIQVKYDAQNHREEKEPHGGSLIVSMGWPIGCETPALLPIYSLQWLAVGYQFIYVEWSPASMHNARLQGCEGRIHAVSRFQTSGVDGDRWHKMPGVQTTLIQDGQIICAKRM